MRLLPSFLLLLAASGCAVRAPVSTLPPTSPKPPRRRSSGHQGVQAAVQPRGLPPAVREGYIDGCESAKRSEYARKDGKRFAADRQYEMGWNDGFSICGARK